MFVSRFNEKSSPAGGLCVFFISHFISCICLPLYCVAVASARATLSASSLAFLFRLPLPVAFHSHQFILLAVCSSFSTLFYVRIRFTPCALYARHNPLCLLALSARSTSLSLISLHSLIALPLFSLLSFISSDCDQLISVCLSLLAFVSATGAFSFLL